MTSLLTSCHIRYVCGHYKCLFYSDLPQTTINKAINNLRKYRNARVLADGEHLLTLCELGSRAYYGITSSKLEIIE